MRLEWFAPRLPPCFYTGGFYALPRPRVGKRTGCGFSASVLVCDYHIHIILLLLAPTLLSPTPRDTPRGGLLRRKPNPSTLPEKRDTCSRTTCLFFSPPHFPETVTSIDFLVRVQQQGDGRREYVLKRTAANLHQLFSLAPSRFGVVSQIAEGVLKRQQLLAQIFSAQVWQFWSV